MTTFVLNIEDKYLINCQKKINEVINNETICQSVKDYLIKSVKDDELKHIRNYLKNKYVLNAGDEFIVNGHHF